MSIFRQNVANIEATKKLAIRTYALAQEGAKLPQPMTQEDWAAVNTLAALGIDTLRAALGGDDTAIALVEETLGL